LTVEETHVYKLVMMLLLVGSWHYKGPGPGPKPLLFISIGLVVALLRPVDAIYLDKM